MPAQRKTLGLGDLLGESRGRCKLNQECFTQVSHIALTHHVEKRKRPPEQALTCSACWISAAGYGLRHSCEPHRSAPMATTVKSHPRSFSMAYAFLTQWRSYSLASEGRGRRQQGQQPPKVRVPPPPFQPRAHPTSPPATAPYPPNPLSF